MNGHSPEVADLLIRWMKALWELVDETGSPQPASAVGQRADMTRDEYIAACAFATIDHLHRKLECEDPLAAGHLYEYLPLGER